MKLPDARKLRVPQSLTLGETVLNHEQKTRYTASTTEVIRWRIRTQLAHDVQRPEARRRARKPSSRGASRAT